MQAIKCFEIFTYWYFTLSTLLFYLKGHSLDDGFPVSIKKKKINVRKCWGLGYLYENLYAEDNCV